MIFLVLGSKDNIFKSRVLGRLFILFIRDIFFKKNNIIVSDCKSNKG